MSGYGGSGPATNNQPLEFGNRLGSSVTSAGTNGSPEASERRGPRSRGGGRGGRSGGRYQESSGAQEGGGRGGAGGGDYGAGRRNDGGRRDRDRSRWENNNSNNNTNNSNMAGGGGMVPPGGGMMAGPNTSMPLLPGPGGPQMGPGPDQMAMAAGGGGQNMWDMPLQPPQQPPLPQQPQPQGPNMMGYNMGGGNMGGNMGGGNMGGNNMGGNNMGGNNMGGNNMGGGNMGGNNMGGNNMGGNNMGGNMGGGNMGGNNMGGNNMGGNMGPNMGGGNMGGNMEGNMGGGMEMNNMGFMGGSGAVDPSMMMASGQYNLLPAGMQQPLYPQLPGTWMPDGNFVPIKEVITCGECVLYPPNPNARPTVTRERPPGCRTAFVGGMPENVTEEMLRDLFRRCGEISSVRMSQKNFAHIRFELEVYVEYAIMLSGYRMKIRNETDAPNTGRLHCDYAQARDDTYEWECQQRILQREMRHRQRQIEDMTRPPSPPPVTHYTHHEAQQLMEKIKDENTFGDSAQLLSTWLERGDCNKRTAGNFYSMIQSTNSHVRRLMSERSVIEEELAKMREQGRLRQQQVIVQFGQIEHVFSAACQQKVWDHFSKAQRKNIELWKKQATEIKKVQIDELSGERAEEEMELSDDDEPTKKKPRKQTAQDEQDDAADALRCQLEAYKNEAEMVRYEHKEEMDTKDSEMNIMRKTMQNVQQQLLSSKSRETNLERQVKLMKAQMAKLKLKATKDAKGKDDKDGKDEEKEGDKASKDDETEEAEAEEDSAEETADLALLAAPIDGEDARIIGLSAAFLNVHPDGANCDYIWSYLQQFPGYVALSPRDVEAVLSRYSRVFKEIVSGVGAKLERKWSFVGYTPPQEVE